MGKAIKDIFGALESREVTTKIGLSLFFFVLLYFLYQALTTNPMGIGEMDSLTYHIPIAKEFARGNFFPPDLPGGLGYYPAIGELMLAIQLILKIPLGFYNIIGVIALFSICHILAKRFGLKTELSIVFAVSICLLNSVIRLIPAQKNDIWLLVFFLTTLYLLYKPGKTIKYFLTLGMSIGLLVGVKYSGKLFALILLLVLGRKVLRDLNGKRLIAILIPIALLGASWYIRNFFLTGNPFYPGNILGFIGHSDFYAISALSAIKSPGGPLLFIEALFSEYLLWALIPVVLLYVYVKDKKLLRKAAPIIVIGLLSTLLYLFLPSDFARQGMTSNLRFMQPAMTAFILSVFLIFKESNKELSILAILGSAAVLTNLDYYPKLVSIWLILVALIMYWKGRGIFIVKGEKK